MHVFVTQSLCTAITCDEKAPMFVLDYGDSDDCHGKGTLVAQLAGSGTEGALIDAQACRHARSVVVFDGARRGATAFGQHQGVCWPAGVFWGIVQAGAGAYAPTRPSADRIVDN